MVNDQQVTFNVLKAMKSPDEVEDCHFVSVVELTVTENLNYYCSKVEIKVTRFEKLEDEDAVAVHLACLGDK